MLTMALKSSCTHVTGLDRLHIWRGHSRTHYCSQVPRGRTAVAALPASDPALQELIMGSGVISAVGAALYNGFKGEPEICDLCQGTGGVKCFGCDATGQMKAISLDNSRQKRDFFGRSIDPRTCRVCKGTCAILCRKCSGTGYINKF